MKKFMWGAILVVICLVLPATAFAAIYDGYTRGGVRGAIFGGIAVVVGSIGGWMWDTRIKPKFKKEKVKQEG
ncbi:hypothetical protein D3C81_519850 [compost metagenome]